jgi:hypothetical protein
MGEDNETKEINPFRSMGKERGGMNRSRTMDGNEMIRRGSRIEGNVNTERNRNEKKQRQK